MNIFLNFKNKLKPYYLPLVHKAKFIYQNLFFKTNGNAVLTKTHKILTTNDKFFWLDFGTLLGVYRDGKLIGHDLDIDIAMFYKDYDLSLKKLLTDNGFVFVREITCEGDSDALEQTYRYKNVNLDIFYYHKDGDMAYCHLFPEDENNEMSCNEIHSASTSFKKTNFLGLEFNIPKNTDKRLEDTYGEDWKIPIKNWYTPRDALNAKAVEGKVNITYK